MQKPCGYYNFVVNFTRLIYNKEALGNFFQSAFYQYFSYTPYAKHNKNNVTTIGILGPVKNAYNTTLIILLFIRSPDQPQKTKNNKATIINAAIYPTDNKIVFNSHFAFQLYMINMQSIKKV